MRGKRIVGGVLVASLLLCMLLESSATSLYGGFYGCKFDRTICKEDEFCVEDCLFGSCNSNLRDNICFDLNTNHLWELLRVMEELISDGYSWADLRTQCKLSSLFLSVETPLPYDPYFCDIQKPSYNVQEQLSNDAVRLLTRYLNDRSYPELDRSPDFDYPYYPSYDMDKRANQPSDNDEFVNIHKYLKSHKRGSYEPSYPDYYDYDVGYVDDYGDYPSNLADYGPGYDYAADTSPLAYSMDGNDYPQSVISGGYPQSIIGGGYPQSVIGGGYPQDFDDDSSELTVEDYVKLLKTLTNEEIEYLQRQLLDYMEDFADYTTDNAIDYDVNDVSDDKTLPLISQQDEHAMTAESMQNEGPSADEPLIPSAIQHGSDYTDMSREDAVLLKQLLEDELNVFDLDSDTTRRLSGYVDVMLETLQGEEAEAGTMQQKLNALVEGLAEYDETADDNTEEYVQSQMQPEDAYQYPEYMQPDYGSDNAYDLEYTPPEFAEAFMQPDLIEGESMGQPEFTGESMGQPEFTGESMGQPEFTGESMGQPEFTGDSMGQPEFIGKSMPGEFTEGAMQPEAALDYVQELSNSKRAPQIASDTDSIEDANPVHLEVSKKEIINTDYVYVKVTPKNLNQSSAIEVVRRLEKLLDLDFDDISLEKDGKVSFRTQPNQQGKTSAEIAKQAETENVIKGIKNETGCIIVSAGVGKESEISVQELNDNDASGPKYFLLTFSLCACFAILVIAGIAIYVYQRHAQSRDKLHQLNSECAEVVTGEPSQDYQDLCRQRMQSKTSEKPEPLAVPAHVTQTMEGKTRGSQSSHSSTSSWSEEPAQTNMDISTGHIVLAYMEDHLANKERLDEEWEGLQAYEAEPNATSVATEPANARKNRYADALPYDHSRVVLTADTNVSASDYINASSITDHDPRSPAYIATQGPLAHTVADFWQMVWEQGSVVIVNLSKLTENGNAMCHRYWPEEGSDLYHIYEVHLVSEHIWCEEYMVRSFYLKNLQTNETRTVTQFHFVAWPDLGIPASIKVLLDFRRKVNKSYRGRSCPIVVHCSDGMGRTGTYCVIDMVLNRMSKGAKEIDIAATLEHIRDQRLQMVKTKEQFELALSSVAEEVNSILKALPSS